MRKTVRIMLPCVCVVCMCARKRKCVSSEPGLELYVLLYLSLIRTHVSMSSPAPKVSIPIITNTTTGTLCHAALTHIYVMLMCEWVRILHMRMPPLLTLHLSPFLPHLLTLLLAVSYVLHAHVYMYVCLCVCVIRTFRAAFWHLNFSRSYYLALIFPFPSLCQISFA